MASATLKITGMSCTHCVQAVTQALLGTVGVEHAQVDLTRGRATIEYDPALTSARVLANLVMDTGYVAEEVA